MITFEVNDMTCGHCVASIARAVEAIDPGAKVHVDLPTHRVRIEPNRSNAIQLADAIEHAGYTPTPLGGEASPPEPSMPRKGCCCR
ncbi:MAG: heavy-metal-associated domain-containing protein [Burkholderiales bacterium]|nr:heavy-metal-associated domain-containing protein [Burkholderiales bacterium]